MSTMKEFKVRPTPDDPRLSIAVEGIDHEGRTALTSVVTEKPLTLFLNAREIVTMMTIGDQAAPQCAGIKGAADHAWRAMGQG